MRIYSGLQDVFDGFVGLVMSVTCACYINNFIYIPLSHFFIENKNSAYIQFRILSKSELEKLQN